MSPSIPFADLVRDYHDIQTEIDAALSRVLQRGHYILGAEVAAFEQEFAAYCGAHQCIAVASGSDALYLSLAALRVRDGEEVITVANACTYQAEAIIQTGALPFLVDIDPETSTLNPNALEAAITPRTRAIIPVHLHGRMADMATINAVAARHMLLVVEDASQAHGAWARNPITGQPQQAGTWGHCGCFSFYPTKNLGAMGDGGAVVTNDEDLAERIRWLRQYGWSSKYVMAEKGGRNSRLDELQAALLRVKLRHLDRWNAQRRERAAWYRQLLASTRLKLPTDDPGHVYHHFVIQSEHRDALRQALISAGIGCDIHYPLPTHLQPGYASGPGVVRPYGMGTLPRTEAQAQRILSLPLSPHLTYAEVEQIAATICAWEQTISAP